MKRKRNIFWLIAALAVVAWVLSLVFAPAAGAQTLNIFDGVNSAQGSGQPEELFGDTGVFTTVVNLLLYVIGGLSIIMIIVGGIRYVVSGGNQTNITAAKNTIMYAVVGLLVAFLAYAAINFILGSLGESSGLNGV